MKRPIQPAARAAAGAILCAVASACAGYLGGVEEVRAAYRLEVVNELPEAMIVAYDDGTGVRLLGTVASGESQSFTIVNPARTSVSVIARDASLARTVVRQATLAPRGTARAILSN